MSTFGTEPLAELERLLLAELERLFAAAKADNAQLAVKVEAAEDRITELKAELVLARTNYEKWVGGLQETLCELREAAEAVCEQQPRSEKLVHPDGRPLGSWAAAVLELRAVLQKVKP